MIYCRASDKDASLSPDWWENINLTSTPCIINNSATATGAAIQFAIATDEEDLTPEERRKLERKLKKERKKEEKKLMREAGISTKKEEPKKLSGSELALAYLTSWSKNPEEWKFQKTRQTWLLLHMYDKEKVPDEYFTILLDYLEGLRGSARDTTVQKAEALMKELDGSDAEDPSMVEKSERIRQVLQLLS
ncbi:uncharacterized protein C7orf50 homolog isoform X2 [Cygnus olor]|uniref:uncharacterized protein C7orf50 homolog isoform X2 n=1 Tax=Cygnus olor TaxID=8869 RepID=UPI001ADE49A0|nr:uncharacterized protein C7orf50 homolog isoform X2 [Cygnus olor]